MSLIHPAILYGLALGVIPVLLHLLLRAKPKKLVFPALRLIQVRRRQNVRRMRLRHIWLLLLRIVVIAALVLAIARPSLPAADYGLKWQELLLLTAVVAVAFGAYRIVMSFWTRRRLPHHTLVYRRTYLRAGTTIAAVVLALLLVAWPYQRRISAEVAAPLPEVAENVPVAGVFLFDTSLSMQYQQDGRTRLDVAKRIAIEHLENVPTRSRVAVGDTSTSHPLLFQADLVGAQSRVEELEIRAVSHPFNDRVRLALELHEADRRRTLDEQGAVADDQRRDAFVREIYVFTDLSQSAWSLGGTRSLRDELQRRPWVNVYLIDVGVTAPVNVGLSDLRLSNETVPLGGGLIIEAAVTGVGVEDAERTVELSLKTRAGKLGQQTVKVSPQSSTRLQFPLNGLTQPINQGELRLVSSDPLSADDVLYFTVAAQPPPQILLIAPRRDDAFYLLEALAPAEFARQGRARYQCDFVTADKAADADPAKYAVVCLVNVPGLPDAVWERLATFVKDGGGVSVFLGSATFTGERGVDPVSYNSPAAQAFLPAELLAALKFNPPSKLDLRDLTHPVLRKFEAFSSGAAELASLEIRRYWKVQPNDRAAVIAPYSNVGGQPALLERPHGSGRSLMLTTGVSLKGWSDLPRSWQFVALADQAMQYLARRMEDTFNYSAGQDVILHVDQEHPVRNYLLGKPGLQQLPGEVPAGSNVIVIREANQLGHYEVTSADKDSQFKTGFSANAAARESDFRRLTETDLNELFGEKRYSVAQDIAGLTRSVTAGRLGQELFPMLMLFLLVFFCGEHFVANRFYESEQAVTA